MKHIVISFLILVNVFCFVSVVNADTNNFTITANDNNWQDTGILLHQNENITVTASGQWCWGVGATECSGPDGTTGRPHVDELPVLVDNALFGEVVAKVGNSTFIIGSSSTFTTTETGNLMLAMNDRPCCYGDNSGTMQATIVTPISTGPYNLTVSKTGTGSGTVTSKSTGISCGIDCSESYTANTVVTLTATASEGSIFEGWSGACSGTGTCILTMDAEKNVSCQFSTDGQESQDKVLNPILSLLLGSNLPADCIGEFGGTAYLDNCRICVGGNTGKEACPYDSCTYWGTISSKERIYEKDCTMANDLGQTVRDNIQYTVNLDSGGHYIKRFRQISEGYTTLNLESAARGDYNNMIPGNPSSCSYNNNFPIEHNSETYLMPNAIRENDGTCNNVLALFFGTHYVIADGVGGYVPDGYPMDWGEGGKLCPYPEGCTAPCSASFEATCDWVVSHAPSYLSVDSIGCNDWWDHYDDQGNWVECVE